MSRDFFVSGDKGVISAGQVWDDDSGACWPARLLASFPCTSVTLVLLFVPWGHTL